MNPKVVMLFGAGASFGSGGIKSPPPLGTSLFNVLTETNPTWHELLSDTVCVDEFNRGFEYGMDYILEKQSSARYGDLYTLLKELAFTLLDYHIQKPDNNQYYKLCQMFSSELKKNELQFATLNYDCLIEEAISLAIPNAKVCYLGNSEGIKLLKPHGSCNFVAPPGIMGGGKIALYKPENLIMPFVAIPPNDVKERLLDSGGTPPVMSIYNTTKVNSIRSEQIESIRREFQESISGAELVIVVGVYPKMDGDDHIWDVIRNAQGRIGLVDKKEYCNSWRDKYRKGRDDPVLGERFISSFGQICKLIDEYI